MSVNYSKCSTNVYDYLPHMEILDILYFVGIISIYITLMITYKYE